MRAVWKQPSQHRVPAQVAFAEVERVRQAYGGAFTPAELVWVSRPETAALHEEFDWPDAIAGPKWREEQARQIVRHVVVVPDNPTVEDAGQRAYVSVVVERCNDLPAKRYTATTEALADPRLRAQIVTQALRELGWWVRKYRDLPELAAIVRAINDGPQPPADVAAARPTGPTAA